MKYMLKNPLLLLGILVLLYFIYQWYGKGNGNMMAHSNVTTLPHPSTATTQSDDGEPATQYRNATQAWDGGYGYGTN